MLPEAKENMVSFVCSLWESVFKISVMWGWVYSGNYPSEEKQSKSLSKLRQNLLVPQIYSGQPLITLSERSFTLYLTYLTLYLLRCISAFTSKDRFGDLRKRIQQHLTEKCSVCFRRKSYENDLLRMQNFNGQTHTCCWMCRLGRQHP